MPDPLFAKESRMKTEDLSGLKAGPLAGQDLSLLKAGSSVVWSQTRRTLCVVQCVEEGIGLHVRWLVAESGVQLVDIFEAFSYIGERGEDGWISWSGGENPVPGMVVDIRVTGDYEYAVASDDWDWDFEPDPIIAFRVVASDHSPSSEADPHRLAETGVVSGPGDYAPWAAEWIEENSDWCVMGAEQMDLEGDCYTPSICTLSDWVSGKEAALMAAAPDLLEACQNMSGLYDTPVERRRRGDDPLYAEAVKHLRAAVEKATAANSLGTPEGVKPKAQPSITKGGDL